MQEYMFDYWNITVDAAAELLFSCMVETGKITLKCCKSFEDLTTPNIKSSEEAKGIINKYKKLLLISIKEGELQTTNIKKQLENNEILTSDTRVAFSQLVKWMNTRNIPIKSTWGFCLSSIYDCYNNTEDEFLFRMALEKQGALAAKLNDLDIFANGFSLDDLARITKDQLYDLCKYLLITTYKLENETTKIDIPTDAENMKEASLRAIGYLAMLLAKTNENYRWGKSINASSMQQDILALNQKLSSEKTDDNTPTSQHGLRRIDSKIKSGIALIEDEANSSFDEILQMLN